MVSEQQRRFSGDQGREKCIAVLLKNELVSQNTDIAAKIFDNSKLVQFYNQELIISEGDDSDCVYFLISGSVEISIKGKQVTRHREAPEQVGEMAALNPEDVRSASVKAISSLVIALKIDANSFGDVIKANPKMMHRAATEQNNRNKFWKSPNTEAVWFDRFLNTKSAAVTSAIFAATTISFYLAQWFSLLSVVIIFLMLVTTIFGLSLWFNRIRFLMVCFGSSGLSSVAYLTNPFTYEFNASRSWFDIHLTSVPEISFPVLLTLVLITMMFGVAAIFCHWLENR